MTVKTSGLQTLIPEREGGSRVSDLGRTGEGRKPRGQLKTASRRRTSETSTGVCRKKGDTQVQKGATYFWDRQPKSRLGIGLPGVGLNYCRHF